MTRGNWCWRMKNNCLRVLALCIVAVGTLACIVATIGGMPTPTAQIANTRTPLPTRFTAVPTRVVGIFAVVRAESLNVRSGPGIEYNILDWLYAGERVRVTKRIGKWAFIGSGWVHGDFLRLEFRR